MCWGSVGQSSIFYSVTWEYFEMHGSSAPRMNLGTRNSAIQCVPDAVLLRQKNGKRVPCARMKTNKKWAMGK